MQGVDLIIAAIIAFSVVVGAIRGFIREVSAVVSWVVGIWLAWRFSGFLHPYLGGVLDEPQQKAWAARVIVLVAVLVVGNSVGALLAWFMHTAAGLGLMDRLIGLLFGFARGSLIVSFLVIVGHSLEFEREAWWRHSSLIPYAEPVSKWLEKIGGHHGAEIRHRFDLPPLPGER
jgi:membrane protein required for colicin V production